jgi:hypothetical protein
MFIVRSSLLCETIFLFSMETNVAIIHVTNLHILERTNILVIERASEHEAIIFV